MENRKQITEKLLVSVTEKLVKQNVNSACLWFFHQSKLPKGYEKFKNEIK